MSTSKRILVTGADGFIGSHLTEALVLAGHDVRAFIHYNSFNSWGWLDSCAEAVKGGFEPVLGDVRDPAGVRAAVAGRDVVLHLAALIGIPYSYRAAASYIDTNVTGTLNVLEAARAEGVGRVVHTSTSEVYGTARFVPIAEDHPLNAQSPYAATKIAADQLALSYFLSFETPVCVIRPFNTFGPRQSARAVIPTAITQILAGKPEIRLGALEPTRDFNYVKDIVRGFAAALDADGIDGEVINLGTGFDISIGDTVKLIADALGAEVSVTREDSRVRPPKSEVERLQAANGKARALLGWTPGYAGRDGFKKAIAETAEWFARPENRALYKPDMFAV
jgi:NAD dependent epimerase/dehydratase